MVRSARVSSNGGKVGRGYSRVLHDGRQVRFGRFDIDSRDPRFPNAGMIGDRHHLVFPGTAVVIRQAGRDPFVADPNVIVLYNRFQPYERRRVSEEGDHCFWATYREDLVLEALDDVRSPEDPDRPFFKGFVRGDEWGYLIHRTLARCLGENTAPDTVEVEEILLHILEQVTSRLTDTAHDEPSPRKARELAEEVKGILNLNLSASLDLETIAEVVGVSPYHLCRVFRSVTGRTVGRYRTQLRLRTALRCLATDGCSLSDLAAELGFASHSYFSSTFRRHFGITPSEFRDRASGLLLEDLRSRLDV